VVAFDSRGWGWLAANVDSDRVAPKDLTAVERKLGETCRARTNKCCCLDDIITTALTMAAITATREQQRWVPRLVLPVVSLLFDEEIEFWWIFLLLIG